MRRIVALATVIAFGSGAAHGQGPVSLDPGNPHLTVASVKMAGGIRLSKMIGVAIYGDATTQLGTLDDLIMTPDHAVVLAILAIGGLMGVGAKLVAVPIDRLQAGANGRWVLPGATNASLNALPAFVYDG